MIRELTDENDLAHSVQVIRESFQTVADEFGLTEENCPTNPAFIRLEHLEELREKGAKIFGLFADAGQIGFTVIEKVEESLFDVRRLAVLPDHRHRGLGKKLMEFACDYTKKEKGERVAVRIMDNNLPLKEWYKTLGFVETGTKKFGHLPFAVCFMEKEILA